MIVLWPWEAGLSRLYSFEKQGQIISNRYMHMTASYPYCACYRAHNGQVPARSRGA